MLPGLNDGGCHLVHPEVNQILDPLYEVNHPCSVVESQVASAEKALGVEQLLTQKSFVSKFKFKYLFNYNILTFALFG